MSSISPPQHFQSADMSVTLQKDENVSKPREREERLRLARERCKEEQRRKIEELRESMIRAEEFRKKQEEERRRKIEEMRRRDEQRRANVEERRRKLWDEESERKQAILRKTEAKFEQTKQKKSISGASVALQSVANSIAHLTSFEQDEENGMLDDDFRYSEDCRKALESPVPLLSKSKTHTITKKRLSSSVDQIARIRMLMYEEQVENSKVEGSQKWENGLESPCFKTRTKSITNIRRSRADMQKTVNNLAISKVDLANADVSQPAVVGKKATADRSCFTPTIAAISRSTSFSKTLGTIAMPKSSGNSQRGFRLTSTDAIVAKGQQASVNATSKPVPSTPKTLASRLQPKTPKDGTSNKVILPMKGIVKAVHDPKQKGTAEKKKDLPPGEAKDRSESASPTSELGTDKMLSEEEEYKLKLAEKRRLAREKAEREAEEERQREEERRREEEEKQRLEEEEQRRQEEEEQRAVEEAKRLEEERFRLAVEETELQKRIDCERLELERQEKLAMEIKVKEEMERKDKERHETLKRDEEERLERKKKLEMIMKRVKIDESNHRADAPANFIILNQDAKENKPGESPSACPVINDDDSQKFRSPLLRQLMEKRGKLTGQNRTNGTGSPLPDFNLNKEMKSDSETDSGSEDVARFDQIQGTGAYEMVEQKLPSLPTSEVKTETGVTMPCSGLNSDSSTVASETETCLEVVNLSLLNDSIIKIKTSDDNQNWTITDKHQEPDDCIDQVLPDLPRIAFEENSIKNQLNTLPDILL